MNRKPSAMKNRKYNSSNSLHISDNWYVIDSNGNMQGPMEDQTLVQLYHYRKIHEKSHVWNGTTVKKWASMTSIPRLLSKMLTEDISTNIKPPPASSNITEYGEIISPTKINSDSFRFESDDELVNNQIEKPNLNRMRTNLMSNIRNGIILRNNLKTNQKNSQIPKRLKDNFNTKRTQQKKQRNKYKNRDGKSRSLPLSSIEHDTSIKIALNNKSLNKKKNYLKKMKRNEMIHSNDDRTRKGFQSFDQKNISDDEISSSFSASIDKELHNIQKKRYYRRSPIASAFNTNDRELLAKAARIRRTYGQVEITAGKGIKPEIDENEFNFKPGKYSVDRRKSDNNPRMKKSKSFRRRMKKIKRKLDKLTEVDHEILISIGELLNA